MRSILLITITVGMTPLIGMSQTPQSPTPDPGAACLVQHRREVDLSIAAANLIYLRDQRKRMEAIIQTDSQFRSDYGAGMDQLMTDRFLRYQKLGGTAATVADVVPMPNPCPSAGPSLPPRPESAMKIPDPQPRSIVVVPK